MAMRWFGQGSQVSGKPLESLLARVLQQRKCPGQVGALLPHEGDHVDRAVRKQRLRHRVKTLGGAVGGRRRVHPATVPAVLRPLATPCLAGFLGAMAAPEDADGPSLGDGLHGPGHLPRGEGTF